MEDVTCRRCNVLVDVWSYGKALAFWLIAGSVATFVGLLLIPLGIGAIIAPFGVLMVVASPVSAAVIKGMRRCAWCKTSWRPGKDRTHAAV